MSGNDINSKFEHRHMPLIGALGRYVNTRRFIKWGAIVAVLAVLAFVALSLPRIRSLPEGYTYAYFPRGGHRYLIAPGGIKKVGQEVLDY